MNHPNLSSVPLLGALCVAAGLVSQENIAQCLTLQHSHYPGTPIGQILVLKGYFSQTDLARMVAQQQSFRRTLSAALDDRFDQQVDAPPVTAMPETAPRSALPELGTFTAIELDDSPLFGTTS